MTSQPCDNGVMHALNNLLNENLFISEQLTCTPRHDHQRLEILLKSLVTFGKDPNKKKVNNQSSKSIEQDFRSIQKRILFCDNDSICVSARLASDRRRLVRAHESL